MGISLLSASLKLLPADSLCSGSRNRPIRGVDRDLVNRPIERETLRLGRIEDLPRERLQRIVGAYDDFEKLNLRPPASKTPSEASGAGQAGMGFKGLGGRGGGQRLSA
ncbi:hypothetical protein BJ508DRAFT_301840 [Ascobolus immersus RN42]|uniref:Uncharacterized protein n=1 Tax=Ascobolus immersus RN42 TaxID=1160509 RepID=A0A3N4IP26_ASCIM|nr:hypothetical protein BJ508DRAFT_301840 [Ascobolus immersus RN42]